MRVLNHTFLNSGKALTFFALALLLTLTSCKKKEGCTDPASLNFDPEAEVDNGSCQYPPDELDVPSTYNFSNVFYGGQTVRLLLLQDLEAAIGGIASGTPVTAQQLTDILDNTAGAYSSIATGKNLSGSFLKSSANSGINAQWNDSLNTWFNQLEMLSSGNTYVRWDGVDLKQMVGKVLMGAVFYDQAVNKYLSLVPNDDNDNVTPGQGTSMEHHFDEAFGYFGAARDYNSYSDAEIKSPGEKDSDNDATIDPQSEKCFYYGQTAAKRDVGSAGFASGKTDYTKTLFDAWLRGRAAISAKEYTERDAAITTIKNNWEEIIAATVVHYANETKNDITTSSTDLSKHWSELRGYFFMLSLYPDNKLGGNLSTVENLIGFYPAQTSVANLDSALSYLQSAYGFTNDQINGW